MYRQIRFTPIVLLSALLQQGVLCPVLRAEENRTGPSVVLLQNGNVLRGEVIRVGDRWRIRQGSIETKLEGSQVELVCSSIDEVYHSKRSGLRVEDTENHLKLASWCVKQGLLGYAAEELQNAIRHTPGHPAIAPLERQLSAALARPRHRVRSTSQKPSARSSGATKREKQLTAELFDEYRKVVQPSLLRSCATSTCHGFRGKSPFRLYGSSSKSLLSFAVTRRNVSSILTAIDFKQPPASKILAVHSRGEFANPNLPQLTTEERAALRQWVTKVVTQKQSGSDFPNFSEPQLEDQSFSDVLLTDSQEKSLERSTANNPEKHLADQPKPRQPRELGRKTPKRFVARDPFDPELFNRKYHPRPESLQ